MLVHMIRTQGRVWYGMVGGRGRGRVGLDGSG